MSGGVVNPLQSAATRGTNWVLAGNSSAEPRVGRSRSASGADGGRRRANSGDSRLGPRSSAGHLSRIDTRPGETKASGANNNGVGGSQSMGLGDGGSGSDELCRSRQCQADGCTYRFKWPYRKRHYCRFCGGVFCHSHTPYHPHSKFSTCAIDSRTFAQRGYISSRANRPVPTTLSFVCRASYAGRYRGCVFCLHARGGVGNSGQMAVVVRASQFIGCPFLTAYPSH